MVAPTGGLESLSASIVDGADQLDVEKNPIKRMCEAHAKQKIVDCFVEVFVVGVDDSKWSAGLPWWSTVRPLEWSV